MENSSRKKIKPNYTRIVTAVMIAVAMLGAIYYGNDSMGILILVINVLGARELSFVLQKKKSSTYNVVYMSLGILPFLIMYWTRMGFGDIYGVLLLISTAVMLFLIVNLWFGKLNYSRYRYAFVLLYWGLPLSLGAYFLLFGGVDMRLVDLGIIVLIWTSDTMAYFTGKAIGKNKLFPSVSPGKTIEGSTGAGVFCVLMAVAFAYFSGESYQKWIGLALVVWIFGTLGDLVESRLKRVQQVKDSGSILPGHGGFLDRFDSLVLLVPILLTLEYFFR